MSRQVHFWQRLRVRRAAAKVGVAAALLSLAVVVALLAYELTLYFVEYASRDTKNEIQGIYGKELNRYRLKHLIPDLSQEKKEP